MKISELARRCGLARSTLLYYEKLGVIAGTRGANGYRHYDDEDLQRLQMVQALQAGGLSLKQCLACLAGEIDQAELQARVRELDDELARMQRARDLLADLAGLRAHSGEEFKAWQLQLQREAPEAYFAWVMKQGFSEKDRYHLQWLSKDMNEHERYIKDFIQLLDGMSYWGPGDRAFTQQQFAALPIRPRRILDMGCGRGASTMALAQVTDATIVAIDLDEEALAAVARSASAAGLSQVTTLCANMAALPDDLATADLIWAEGSAYVMGVANALKAWRPLLASPLACIVLSDAVWLTDNPPEEALAFWQQDYPAMQTLAGLLETIQAAGYRCLSHTPLPMSAWSNYLDPIERNLARYRDELGESPAWQDLSREIAIHRQYLGSYGYVICCLQAA
ncbi:MerR family transcriptional regulator [Aeromonas jandaei]|uniref:MerR family transcriptional regulator n=1 Tax=Aeromonas jandaei TaxID=650 RepID=UPI00191F4829|nr:MerR family transcriptional regulator [Aeromonas jandaei]MBL0596286.1 MerR family transcriptional regulator [Aeromonas jandaei]